MKELSKLEVWELAIQNGLRNNYGGVDKFDQFYNFINLIYKKAQEETVKNLLK